MAGISKFRKAAKKLGLPCTSFTVENTPEKRKSGEKILSLHNEATDNGVIKIPCPICLEPLNSGNDDDPNIDTNSSQAVFTAECSHAFHFLCISSNVRHGNTTCPICRAQWAELPRRLTRPQQGPTRQPPDPALVILEDSIATSRTHRRSIRHNGDDPVDPTPSSATHPRLCFALVPIARGLYPRGCRPMALLLQPLTTVASGQKPFSDRQNTSHRGPKQYPETQSTSPRGPRLHPKTLTTSPRGLKICLETENTSPSRHVIYSETQISAQSMLNMYPESVSSLRSKQELCPPTTAYLYVKLEGPPATDLVMVVNPTGQNLRLFKELMAVVVFSLRPVDRLAIVASSSGPSRTFPLRRMFSQGKRAALQAIDRLIFPSDGDPTESLSRGIVILEERAHRNPNACILFLSDGQIGGYHPLLDEQLSIPIHRFDFGPSFRVPDEFVRHGFEEFLVGLLGGVIRETELRLRVDGARGEVLVELGDMGVGEERMILVEIGESKLVSVGYSYEEGGVEGGSRTGEMILGFRETRGRYNGGHERGMTDSRERCHNGVERGVSEASSGGRRSCAERWEYYDPCMARRWAKHLHGLI
ncbi:hypothetical protein AMTRI_Chr10g233220 [Amborella trichopoda]|uniref:RING-type domain-containing protein n=1 Tax=Amborella trichopoda TaxID=13333 RepID=U5DA52_AMBTC|nr:uncharacterized protein LOC18447444 [Amborella trichopoda]ERN19070.1 hypothetical protein AMTR_s00061p00102790 [Amborella trichopoda]|eukprot:XP_006857603.1 uncharacterized protein LOC18447444 [Amborella trichopoda]